tara:strand:+ start:104 stop:556 length:453 start_codon:yes stop_codon:yes gene_type:complete
MTNILISIFVSLFIVVITTFLFYEILGFVMRLITNKKLTPRWLLLTLILGVFCAHSASVIAYGLAYWILTGFSHYPKLEGIDANNIEAYLYYSATTYSSLGIGDIFPRGCLRIITSFEVINGLTLIAWSATFTYFSVQKMWNSNINSQKT